MGKRSDFPRRPQDAYETWDPNAVAPLLPHLEPGTKFYEPCVGARRLVHQLHDAGHICAGSSDLDDKRGMGWDAMTADYRLVMNGADCFITNPPWSRPILHRIIINLSAQAPTWLLFDAAWAFTKQAAPFLDHCTDIVAVGRVRWIEGTKMSGKDDCAWYRFYRSLVPPNIRFHGRR